MWYEQHNKRAEKIIGLEHLKTIREVNLWIDRYFESMGPAHRRELHHQYGIEAARSLYGDIGARIAELHIKDDYNGEIPRIDEYRWRDNIIQPRDPVVKEIYDCN